MLEQIGKVLPDQDVDVDIDVFDKDVDIAEIGDTKRYKPRKRILLC